MQISFATQISIPFFAMLGLSMYWWIAGQPHGCVIFFMVLGLWAIILLTEWIREVLLRQEIQRKKIDISPLPELLWLQEIKSVWDVKTAFVSEDAPPNEEIRSMAQNADSLLFGVRAVARKETTWTYLG